jgi:Cyclic nucleotide-binding domain/Pyridine nucleotide-disulphide oxidoreductase
MFTIEELATVPLFSALEEKALEYLAGEVEDIHLTPGEYVAHEGDDRALAVVVEGKTELTKLVNGVEQVIGVRRPGELGGEIPMTLGTPLPASMRAVQPSRVMKLTVEVFHTLAAIAPRFLQKGLIESFAPGGQAGTSTRIENYTGFPFGVSGDELASRALRQAKRLGAEIVVTRRVEAIDPAEMTVKLDGGDVVRTRAIILAMGVEWRRLELDSVDQFVGSGVYYGAARSDAGLAQGNDVYLIGAGNSAGQAAIFFAGHARSVTLLVRGESLAESMST